MMHMAALLCFVGAVIAAAVGMLGGPEWGHGAGVLLVGAGLLCCELGHTGRVP